MLIASGRTANMNDWFNEYYFPRTIRMIGRNE